MGHMFERYCKEYENIENYDKALVDNFKGWHCHHRLETHNSDGERRLVDISQKELKALGMYYHRPAEELIFLTSKEHRSFDKGKKRSVETRRKLSIINKGENNPMYGKKHSDAAKKKAADAMKGNKNALGNTNVRGTRWFNNGKINIRAKECPEGFVPGMLR